MYQASGMKLIAIVFLLLTQQAQVPYVEAGIISYGICQSVCNVAWVTCYTLLGAIAG